MGASYIANICSSIFFLSYYVHQRLDRPPQRRHDHDPRRKRDRKPDGFLGLQDELRSIMAERRVHRIVQGSSRNQWDDRRHQNRRRRCLQNSRPDLRVDRDQNRNHEKSQIFIIHKMQKRQINCPEDSAADRRDPEPLPPSSGPSPVRLFSGLSAPFFTFSSELPIVLSRWASCFIDLVTYYLHRR